MSSQRDNRPSRRGVSPTTQAAAERHVKIVFIPNRRSGTLGSHMSSSLATSPAFMLILLSSF